MLNGISCCISFFFLMHGKRNIIVECIEIYMHRQTVIQAHHVTENSLAEQIALRKCDDKKKLTRLMAFNADEHIYTCAGELIRCWASAPVSLSLCVCMRALYVLLCMSARRNDVDDACIAQLQCKHCNRIEMNEIDVTDGDGKQNNKNNMNARARSRCNEEKWKEKTRMERERKK